MDAGKSRAMVPLPLTRKQPRPPAPLLIPGKVLSTLHVPPLPTPRPLRSGKRSFEAVSGDRGGGSQDAEDSGSIRSSVPTPASSKKANLAASPSQLRDNPKPASAQPAPASALPAPAQAASAQPAPAQPAPAQAAPQTLFTQLKDLQQSLSVEKSKKLDVLGTVLCYTRPKRCKGKHEWMSSLLLLDSTLPASKAVCLNFFGPDLAQHPQVRAVGDILLCRRARAQMYLNEPQLVGNSDFRTRFITFHRRIDLTTGFPVEAAAGEESVAAKWDVLRTGSEHVLASDMARVEILHSWTANVLMRTLLGEDKAESAVSLDSLYRRTMSPDEAGEGALGKDSDVTCVVVKTVRQGADLSVLVWDGTTPSRLFDGQTEIEAGAYASLHASLHASTVYLDCIDGTSMSALQPRVLNADTAPHNLLGCCVALVFLAAADAQQTPQLLPGTWVRIRNLSTDNRDAARVPPVVGVIKPDTYVNVLAPYCRNVAAVASRYLKRTKGPARDYATAKEALVIKSIQAPRPAARPQFTACGKPYTPLSLCFATPTPAKFCALCKITDFWPKDLGKFVVPAAPLEELLPRVGLPVTSKHGDLVFAFSVLLVDDTAARSVVVFGKDAEFFLGGITPGQFKANQAGAQETVALRLRDVISEGTKFDFNIRTYLASDYEADGGAFIPEDSPELKRAQVFGTNIMA